ncbi:MAG: hypothetical protein LBR64_01895 [Dysgonamonadaceae bacterium]|jgi:hypothetical protein|nr:hypothetical protein [Dysgonamonadaceae bacterium]
MKYKILLLLLLAFSFSMQAQRMSVVAGYDMSKNVSLHSKFADGFYAGIDYDLVKLSFHRDFWLQTGLMFVSSGFDDGTDGLSAYYLSEDGNTLIATDGTHFFSRHYSLEAPINFSFRFPLGNLKLIADAGFFVRYGLHYSNKAKTDWNVFYLNDELASSPALAENIEVKISGGFKDFYAGHNVALGVEYKRFFAKAQIQIVNFRTNTDAEDFKLRFGLGFRF